MFTEENTPEAPAPAQAEATSTEATPAEATPAEAAPEKPKAPIPTQPSEDRLLAAAAYFPMLFVGALIVKPKSKFCQMHAKQGLVITGIAFLVMFILVAIPAIGSLLFLGLIALLAVGGYQAYSGIEWKIPMLWDVASKINVDQIFAGTTVKPASTDEKPAEKKEEAPVEIEEVSTEKPETPAPTPAPAAPSPAPAPAPEAPAEAKPEPPTPDTSSSNENPQ